MIWSRQSSRTTVLLEFSMISVDIMLLSLPRFLGVTILSVFVRLNVNQTRDAFSTPYIALTL